MLPRLTKNNRRDVGLLDAIAIGEFTLEEAAGGVVGTDSPNVVVSELCERALGAAKLLAPPLAGHVRHVVPMRAEKQVRRIDTRRVVTAMADAKTLRDRAIGKFPRETMRFLEAMRGRPEPAVSTPEMTLPIPARVRSGTHVGFGPKSFIYRLGGAEQVAALATAKLPRTPAKVRGANLKGGAAVGTRSIDSGNDGATLGVHIGGPFTDMPCRRVLAHCVGFTLPQLYPNPCHSGVLGEMEAA